MGNLIMVNENNIIIRDHTIPKYCISGNENMKVIFNRTIMSAYGKLVSQGCLRPRHKRLMLTALN